VATVFRFPCSECTALNQNFFLKLLITGISLVFTYYTSLTHKLQTQKCSPSLLHVSPILCCLQGTHAPNSSLYSWKIRDQLDVTCYYVLFNLFYAQHVSDFNTSIIRSLRLFYWITTLVAVLQPVIRIPPQPSHTETPTHIETRTHVQCGDSIEKSQAPDDGCINVRNMLSIEEMK